MFENGVKKVVRIGDSKVNEQNEPILPKDILSIHERLNLILNESKNKLFFR